MDDGYEYLVAAKDSMSGPLKSAASGADALEAGLKKVDAELKRSGAAHQEAAKHVHEHESALRGLGTALAQGAFGGGGLTSAFAKGELLAHVVEKAAEWAKEGVIFAVEASEFKENAIQAYEVIQGTAEQGAKTFAALDHMATEIHMPTEKAQEIAQHLMLEGLKGTQAVTETVKAIGELQRVGLSSGAAKLESIIARSEAAGHFTLGKGGRGLAGTGTSEDSIAAQLGLTRKQLDAELKAGKIDTETGIAAISKAITTGKVGELATKRFTITDAFVDMKNSIRGVFQETDSGPLVDSLKEVSEQFKEGTKGAEQFEQVVDVIIEGAAKIVGLGAALGAAFTDAAEATKMAWDSTYEFLVKNNPLTSDQYKRDALTNLRIDQEKDIRNPAVRRQDTGIGRVEEASAAGKSPAELQAIGKTYGLDIKAGKQEVDSYFNMRQRLIDADRFEHPELAPKAGAREPTSITKDDVDGKSRELGADAAEGFHKGAADKLKAHSPSMLMYELGDNAAQGFADGARAGTAAADVLTGRGGSSGKDGKAAAGASVVVHVGGIAMHGLVGMEDFAPLLESQVADVFERVALELGQ